MEKGVSVKIEKRVGKMRRHGGKEIPMDWRRWEGCCNRTVAVWLRTCGRMRVLSRTGRTSESR